MQPKKYSIFKAAIALTAATYFFWAAAHPSSWRFIDNVNFVIHEAGHIVFLPFGEFLSLAGGTLLQLIVPTIFVLYFFFREETYSASLLLFWLGESLLNVSVYAVDAQTMYIELVVGEIHDWNYLLGHLGLLDSAFVVGKTFHVIAVIIICSATLFSLKTSQQE